MTEIVDFDVIIDPREEISLVFGAKGKLVVVHGRREWLEDVVVVDWSINGLDCDGISRWVGGRGWRVVGIFLRDFVSFDGVASIGEGDFCIVAVVAPAYLIVVLERIFSLGDRGGIIGVFECVSSGGADGVDVSIIA